MLSLAAAFSSAFAPPAGLANVGQSSMVTMNAANNANVKFNIKSGNGGLYGWQVKKNSKTGDTANLRGYTVGSRAPPMAVSSGTTIAQQGGRYKGVATKGKYTIPGLGGDSGLDLRSFESGDTGLFYHTTNMLAGGATGAAGEEKDCFINRGKKGPLAATNDIFVHSGVWHSDASKDTFLGRL